MPIFFAFTPLEEGDLKNQIYDLAKKLNFPISGVFVIDGSRRSSKSNAFFAGFGKNKRIALFDTLIAECTTKEILAVLGHEIGHYKKKHVLDMFAANIFEFGLGFYLWSVFIQSSGFFEAFGMEHESIYAGIVLFIISYSFISKLLSVLMNLLSRRNEYEADKFSIEEVGLPEDMISCLKKLGLNSLSNPTPHPFYVFLNYSHPPPLERFIAIGKKINKHL